MHYKGLEIWKKARLLVIEIHRLTMEDLPKFEMFETGSQIRRSIKSVKANIVEGYSRRDYKQDFFHFLVIAEGSAEETIDHLETLFETGSLKSEEKYRKIHDELDILVRMLYSFRRSMQSSHLPTPMK
jgi:four helix bundle protein